MPGQTSISIQGEDFWVNGAPTYAGHTWLGHRIEGLLLNARMVQAVFDDLNPATRPRWAYPDTGRWDAERNVQESLAMLPVYRQHGLLAVTVNCQGGSPEGYSRELAVGELRLRRRRRAPASLRRPIAAGHRGGRRMRHGMNTPSSNRRGCTS